VWFRGSGEAKIVEQQKQIEVLIAAVQKVSERLEQLDTNLSSPCPASSLRPQPSRSHQPSVRDSGLRALAGHILVFDI
jgi:hypothetical protein